MANIKINKKLWDAVSDQNKKSITDHLLDHEVIKPGDKIVPDEKTPVPSPDTQVFGATIGDVTTLGLIPGGVCKALCDAAAAAAVAACTASGPALAACLAVIAAAREACRNGC